MKKDTIRTLAFIAVAIVIVLLLVMCGMSDGDVGGLYG